MAVVLSSAFTRTHRAWKLLGNVWLTSCPGSTSKVAYAIQSAHPVGSVSTVNRTLRVPLWERRRVFLS